MKLKALWWTPTRAVDQLEAVCLLQNTIPSSLMNDQVVRGINKHETESKKGVI